MQTSNIEDIFNIEDAILLGAMCYQTYPFFETGKLILPKGFVLQHTILATAGIDNPTEEVFGFIAESQDKIILSFRGTLTREDLDSDLDLFQVLYPFVMKAGKTHRGITYTYKSTRDKLISELDTLSSSKRLYITGHSLGGSLAILAALDIAVNTKFNRPVLYTFAAGRIADPTFVSLFNKVVTDSIRIHNVHDFVPTLAAESYPPPFTKNGLVYEHVNTDYPLYFQLNNIPLNHRINCYFKHLSKKNPDYALALCTANPGFCPNTDICVCRH